MENNQKPKRYSHHVFFTSDEEEQVRMLAEAAGMPIRPYIRQQALHGKVRIIDWTILREHLAIIDCIVNEVDGFIGRRNPNRWLYAPELDLIASLLLEIKAQEAELMSKACETA